MARSRREIRRTRALSKIAVVAALVALVVVAAVSVYVVTEGTKAGPGSLAGLVALSVQPVPILIAPGQVQTYPTLTVQQSGPLPTGPILLSTAGPPGLSVALSQSSVSTTTAQGAAPTSVALTVNSSSSTPPATYNITIKAAVGQLSESQSFPVKVLPALVVMHQVAFLPQNLTVPVGTTVTWLNLDSNIGCCDPGYHNVVFTSGTTASSPVLKRLQSWSYQFNSVGDFSYICSIHPWMVGRITVVQ